GRSNRNSRTRHAHAARFSGGRNGSRKGRGSDKHQSNLLHGKPLWVQPHRRDGKLGNGSIDPPELNPRRAPLLLMCKKSQKPGTWSKCLKIGCYSLISRTRVPQGSLT